MWNHLISGALALLMGGMPVPPAAPITPQASKPNVLIVIMDDVGVENVDCYGYGRDIHTPSIDALAARGVRFERFWAAPVCSPLRACVHTGRYGLRTGIGWLVEPQDGFGYGLPLAETTLPELLSPAGYATACRGKWHLSTLNNGGVLGPNLAGWGSFDGNLGNISPGQGETYYHWERTIDGLTAFESGYATAVQVDAALAAVQSLPQPWLIYLAPNGPHVPFHEPPAELCPHYDLTQASTTDADRFHAAIEALDTKLGQLFAALPHNTLVICLGDNGTPDNAANDGPFAPGRVKGSVYQGGIETPLIVAGPGCTPGRVVQEPVSAVDLFATVADYAGVGTAAIDGVSFRPLLHGGPPARSDSYAEKFQPNGLGLKTIWERAITDGRWKLIRRLGAADEFYDLDADAYEVHELLAAGPDAEQAAAYLALVQALGEIQ